MARTAVKAEIRCLVLYRASLLAEGVARLLEANGPVEVSVVDVQREDPRQILRTFQPHI
ncbi:MAG: hypothetical protein HYX89_04345, partial [Chloroflexi bacterium]|nr:hypothetical protein [Chloroflexota bacterium]